VPLWLTALMLLLRQSWRPLTGWKWLHCAIAGALLNAIGLMAPHVGLLTAPAAQIALVQSLTPLLTAILGMMLLRERLRIGQWLGLALGMAGVAIVVGEAALESTARLQGLVLAFVGVLGLVAGTLYFGRFCRDVPLLPGATAQFISAAAVASLGAWLLETPRADLDRKRHRSRRMEYRSGFSWWHGALLRHACSRHGRKHQRKFLPRPRHRGSARLGCSSASTLAPLPSSD
jgi:drug/metabolite transporter (DMT)-like permease